MTLKPGDICINSPKSSTGCWLIETLRPENAATPYVGINLHNKKRYLLRDDGLIKIGELTADLTVEKVITTLFQPKALPDDEGEKYLRGQLRAEESIYEDLPENEEYWRFLAQARPGDKMVISLGKKKEFVTFHYVLERGEKYVFLAANARGTVYRYPLDVLVLEGDGSPKNRANSWLDNWRAKGGNAPDL
jgi:hypothetical protein